MTGRAEDDFELPFASIVHDAEEQPWVFIGWKTNSAGRFPVFVQQVQGYAHAGWTQPFMYYAAHTDTLLRKFPDLKDFKC